MILRPFLHAEPVAISYLFGCGGKASGAVVDPVGDIEPYLRAAEASGMRILYVIDTHIHADHVSAGRRLASAAGARYVLAAQAAAAPASETVRDGDVLELGNVSVEVLHTPGHTPEHVSLLVGARGERGGRRAGTFCESRAPQGLARLRRSAAGCLLGVGVRPGFERQAVLHNRVRAASQRRISHRRGG